MKCRWISVFALIMALAPYTRAADSVPLSPVDGLTASEYWTVYDVLRDNHKLGEKAHVVSVLLHEPEKQYVLAWKPGDPIRRSADVVVTEGYNEWEGVIDISNKSLTDWKQFPSGTYAPTIGEQMGGGDYIKKDPRVLDILKKRGITDLRMVSCMTLPGGYIGLPEEKEHRVAWGGCSYEHGVERSWGREIAGIFIVVDPIGRKVLRVSDYGEAPMPNGSTEYSYDGGPKFEGQKPLVVLQPEGPSFRIENGEVNWQDWRFRFRIDPRVGLVLNQVETMDHGVRRSIMYEGSLSELFVPYQGKQEPTHSRIFIDAGEYFVAAGLLKPLAPTIDCPANAQYFSGVFYKDSGAPTTIPQLACLFERSSGDPSWRHNEGNVAGRPSRELVLRSVATVGNYDYMFDWRFEENGSIKVGVAATGIVEVTAVKDTTSDAPDGTGQTAQYGHLVDKNIEAINHDHFFSFRLDLDVDGTNNSFMVDKLVTKRLPNGVARKSVWVMKSEMPETELKAIQDLDPKHPGMWRFVSDKLQPSTGNPTSIEIMPGVTELSLISPDDLPQKRGAFSSHSLWVTPYKAGELYAAGKYPTGSKGDDGLAVWTKEDRHIMNTDIVAWYTVGFHHVPRMEDWPVMPVMWHEFEIRPFDFFPKNPTINRSLVP